MKEQESIQDLIDQINELKQENKKLRQGYNLKMFRTWLIGYIINPNGNISDFDFDTAKAKQAVKQADEIIDFLEKCKTTN